MEHIIKNIQSIRAMKKNLPNLFPFCEVHFILYMNLANT